MTLEEKIEIYKKTGATRKVALLEKERDFLSAPAAANPSERGDKNIPSDELIHEMHSKGMDYKEITEITGVKCPWFAIKRHEKTL